MDDIELLTFEDMESMESSLEDLASSTANTSHDSEQSSSLSTTTNKRISPLRGNLSHDELINQTRTVKDGLGALRDDHYSILAGIRNEYENQRNDNKNNLTTKEPQHSVVTDTDSLAASENNSTTNNDRQNGLDNALEARIANVTSSLEKLEVGIEESAVMLALSEHFTRMEVDREGLRLEMGLVVKENEWLREELSEIQKRLMDAEGELGKMYCNVTYFNQGIIYLKHYFYTKIK